MKEITTMDSVTSQIENIRLQLLDLGLRGNTMLHFAPRDKNFISIVDEKSASIFEILRTNGKAMSFLPRPNAYDKEADYLTGEDVDENYEKLPPLQEYLASTKGDDRFVDLFLQTQLSAAQLDLRLLKIEDEAKTVFQEKGIDVLYLALGFLAWYEDSNASKKRLAPLVLLPVELVRTAAGKGFKLNYTGMELTNNETLCAKLKSDFKINLPSFDEYVDGESSFEAYFSAVSSAVKGRDGWEVQADKIELGFFSFGKFQMYKDLDPQSWTGDYALSKHPLLCALFCDGFERDGELLAGESDEALKTPELLHLVKDADSSQTEAILATMRGANMVIQGPPGTGKSQTITNLISEGIAQGKKILFVAQKLTALEVVKHRLEQANLSDAVLELHSHKSRPSDVMNSLKQTLYQEAPVVPDRASERERLQSSRQTLDGYAGAVGQKIARTGKNYVQALGCVIQHSAFMDGVDVPRLGHELFSSLNELQLSQIDADLKVLTQHMENMGDVRNDPFIDLELMEVSPVFQEKLRRKIEQGREIASQIAKKSELLAQQLQLRGNVDFPQMSGLMRAVKRSIDAPNLNGVRVDTRAWVERSQSIMEALDAGVESSQWHEVLDHMFLPQAFTEEAQSSFMGIRSELMGRADKWWRFFSPRFRKAKRTLQGFSKEILPKDASIYLTWMDGLLALSEIDKLWTEQEPLFSALFGGQWQGTNSDWKTLKQQTEWVVELHKEIERGELPDSFKTLFNHGSDFSHLEADLAILNDNLARWTLWKREIAELLQLKAGSNLLSETLTLTEAESLIKSWWESLDKLYASAQLNRLLSDLRKKGHPQIADCVKNWGYSSSQFYHYVWSSFWANTVDHCYEDSANLRHFDRVAHEGLIQEFKAADQQCFCFSQEALVKKLYEALPSKHALGEMEVLRREMNKKRRLMPVRKLLGQAGNAIQKIKPVFMMSPMSVATFLPPESVEFDLVIFDEASQVTVPDAIGAIIRSKQAIVVGDSKQMPPTNTFSKTIEIDDDELDENYTAEIESVLGLFLAQGSPEKMLAWHYRSRHDSLIFTSNQEFYGGHLKVFPSSGAFADATGLEFIHLPNTYYEGGASRRTNKEEAKAVAAAVLEHAKSTPHLSLGVVAFSMVQKDAVLIEVEILRRQYPELESFFSSSHSSEPFFVKNLENVQGDERDVIYISVGYGKSPQGVLKQNFGPLNKSGGERRLNVLISRAKQAMKVFCNFTADELKTDATSPLGLRVFKSFLKYAETGSYAMPKESGKEMESPFEEAVYDAISQLGYDVVPQVGSQGFFIDLAIRDPRAPGKYLLAVECDGASYHSSANARDRDRLRQAVLEGLGWRFHRIWSTDWFRNATKEVQRLKDRIEKELAEDATKHSLALTIEAPSEPEIKREICIVEELEPEEYEKATIEALCYPDFDSIPEKELLTATYQIVAKEGPVAIKAVINRLISAAGLSRAGNKIQSRVNTIVELGVQYGLFSMNGPFLMTKDTIVKVRNRKNMEAAERKLEMVSPDEITLAMIEIVEESMSINPEDCFSEVASRLGFQRVTAQMKEYLNDCLIQLVSNGTLVEQNDRLSCKLTA